MSSMKEKTDKQAVIKKLVLQLGEKEISLSIEDAKKLHAALNEMFEQKIIREEHHHYSPWRWYYGGTSIYPSSGITITPTYPTTTQPIWYSSTAGGVYAEYDNSNQAMTLKVN
jgi:hypothetical protein